MSIKPKLPRPLHSLAIGGSVYHLYKWRRELPANDATSSSIEDFFGLGLHYSNGTWSITGELPYKEHFENLLNNWIHERTR